MSTGRLETTSEDIARNFDTMLRRFQSALETHFEIIKEIASKVTSNSTSPQFLPHEINFMRSFDYASNNSSTIKISVYFKAILSQWYKETTWIKAGCLNEQIFDSELKILIPIESETQAFEDANSLCVYINEMWCFMMIFKEIHYLLFAKIATIIKAYENSMICLDNLVQIHQNYKISIRGHQVTLFRFHVINNEHVINPIALTIFRLWGTSYWPKSHEDIYQEKISSNPGFISLMPATAPTPQSSSSSHSGKRKNPDTLTY